MSKAYYIEAVIVDLERAMIHAAKAGLGIHFQSELSHLVATAKANRPEATEGEGK